jgi:putative ABC transport system permease protein
VSHGSENFSTTINGTTPEFTRVRDFLPLSGRFFNQADLDTAARVALLGQTVVTELGLTPATAVGRTVRIRGESFAVIGTMEYKGSSGPRDQDDVVLVPLTTMAARIVGVNAVSGISVESIAVLARGEKAMEAAQYQITNLLRLRHRIVPPREDDFTVRNQADILSAFNAVANTITLMLGGSAAISLVVGGIGIMNIMLVSVTERTREIGVRRALGARAGDILLQFLIEGVVLTLCGGVLGIALGVGVSLALTRSFGWTAPVGIDAILVPLLFCLAIGVFFGAYPAMKAARLDPITALRSE